MAAQAPRSHADHHPGLRLPPCWVCSRRRGLGRSPHPRDLLLGLRHPLSPNLDHAGSAGGKEPGCSPGGGGPGSRRRPRSLLTTALRLRLTLRVCLTLSVAGPQSRKEGRPSDRAWAREAGPRTHPKEVHLPPGPEALTAYSKQLPTCHGGPVLQRRGRGKDRPPAQVQ